MSEVDPGDRTSGAPRGGCGGSAWRVAGRGLSLTAAPSFAAMAWLTVATDAPDLLCMPAEPVSPFTGMAFMYGLMSVFHLAPWSKLIADIAHRSRGDHAA